MKRLGFCEGTADAREEDSGRTAVAPLQRAASDLAEFPGGFSPNAIIPGECVTGASGS